MSLPLVLASASPRRRELLGLLGLTFDVAPADIDESVHPGEAPAAYVERVARGKAEAVPRPGAVVVAADTTVAVDEHILAKPEHPVDAERMLALLAGRDHLVHTGMAVAYGGRLVSAVETTRVWFRALDADAIAAYVRTGEPLDKAGAYGIQGYGAVLVTKIEGDYFTVMGLGLTRLTELWRAVGISYRFGEGLRPLS